MCDVLHYLFDNIFIRFGSKLYRHIVGIPMGTDYAPLVADLRERSGSVVECLTRDRRVAGSSLTGVTALWSLSKTHLS